MSFALFCCREVQELFESDIVLYQWSMSFDLLQELFQNQHRSVS